MATILDIFTAPAMAPPDANGPAGFTTDWHGHGAGHQANNDPGDTAADRHNFADATAGGSDVNPTQPQGQVSAETGLPLVEVKADVTLPDAAPDDVMDMFL